MNGVSPDQIILEAQMGLPAAKIMIVRYEIETPFEAIMPEYDYFNFDLSLAPRMQSARMSYSNHWAPHRFEQPGRLFMIPPGERVVVRGDGGPQLSINCHINREAMAGWLGLDPDWANNRIDASLDVPGPAIAGLLTRLGEEVRFPGMASDVLCEAIAVQIAIEVSRYLLDERDVPRTSSLPSRRLRLIDERLNELGTPPTLAELATLCGISVRQLTRGFRVSRGRSIGEHIADRRIEHAKDLLLKDHSVKIIAYKMGFKSPSNFCQAFRKATGQSPQGYRRFVAGYPVD